MTPEELVKKRAIKELVENEYFKEVIDEIMMEYGQDILAESDPDKRTEIYYSAKAIERIVGQLTAIANEVTAYGR